MSLTTSRTVSSSPVLANSLSTTNEDSPSVEKTDPTVPQRLATAKHSSVVVKTDRELPVLDITWNYNSYRYKTFETCLKNYYGEKYPPGDVVLNYMQLNLSDSRASMNAAASMFDFVRESETQLSIASRRPEIEYLNPLDYFVAKQSDTPATVERSTGTDEVNEASGKR
ncbi:hypothetical protein WH47_07789 [Habropoda laboriosa]|uniref:Uncharacterized protein n=1 Tax=Habropoda laboriosa TaxID=597456 RepID=A0A0L7QNJ0_9HYME|nr:hypothetical protein WH47_07789 [Habropoda laboriosa]